MLVKEGEEVKAGTPLFSINITPKCFSVRPVSGTLGGRPRRQKRRYQKVVVQAAQEQRCETFDLPALDERIKK